MRSRWLAIVLAVWPSLGRADDFDERGLGTRPSGSLTVIGPRALAGWAQWSMDMDHPGQGDLVLDVGIPVVWKLDVVADVPLTRNADAWDFGNAGIAVRFIRPERAWGGIARNLLIPVFQASFPTTTQDSTMPTVRAGVLDRHRWLPNTTTLRLGIDTRKELIVCCLAWVGAGVSVPIEIGDESNALIAGRVDLGIRARKWLSVIGALALVGDATEALPGTDLVVELSAAVRIPLWRVAVGAGIHRVNRAIDGASDATRLTFDLELRP